MSSPPDLGMTVQVARDLDGALGVLMQVGERHDAVYRFFTPADARLVAESLSVAATLVEMGVEPHGS